MARKLFIQTHGCQMNEYDSTRMVDLLESTHNLEPTDNPEDADVLLLNTCSIREKAQEKVFHQLGRWKRLKDRKPELIIGVGGIGAETARQCKNWGMTTIGIDPRVESAPAGVDELHRPDALDQLLPQANFVILTAPQTPNTEGLFTSAKFEQMRDSAYFINIGRGSNVKLADLDQALREGQIAGAALDVFEEEPLPAGHQLWTAPNFLMTPHVAASGPYLEDRRRDLLVDNCRRFAQGEELVNIVDKENWF